MKIAIQKHSTPWRAEGVPQTGLLADIDADGRPLIEYSGNELGPIPARTIVSSASRGDTVLLVFDQGNPTRPIIIGVVRDRFDKSSRRLNLAANEVLIQGAEELTLSCGDSSLTLRKDGKTVLKGKEVLSRASRTNRIKGATVQIN